MQKNLTIVGCALLGLCADILYVRQTLLTQPEINFSSFPILLSQFIIALSLFACILLFVRKIRSKILKKS